jgi:hypothetical protein
VTIDSVANPNNDPAITHAIAHLETLRDKAAASLIGWREQLLGGSTKNQQERMTEYNSQIATLAKLAMGEQLNGTDLTDSEKNVLVAKFLVNEQARLRLAMNEKATTSKAGKFIKWMSVHGRGADTTVDHRNLIAAIERDESDQPKFMVAQQRLAEIFSKQRKNERRDHRKKATRIAVLGAVGVGATLIGINPATAGDTLNAVAHTGL